MVDLTASSSVGNHLTSLEVNYVTSEDEKAGRFMSIGMEIECSQSLKVRPQDVCQLPPSAFSPVTTTECQMQSITHEEIVSESTIDSFISRGEIKG